MLKSLCERGKTASELSRESKTSVQATGQHLEKMLKAGLVARRANGKWVYFDLTEKGRSVVQPGGSRVLFLLGASALAIIAGVYRLFPTIPTQAPAPVLGSATDKAFAESTNEVVRNAAALDPSGVVLLVVGSLAFGYFARELVARRLK